MAAGSNPRQKTINLMYLVLIAMLALNVDTKVLKSFSLIRALKLLILRRFLTILGK